MAGKEMPSPVSNRPVSSYAWAEPDRVAPSKEKMRVAVQAGIDSQVEAGGALCELWSPRIEWEP